MKKTVLLGVTGGIAAFKSASLASLLKQRNYDVLTILTTNATKFITPLTFKALTRNPVSIDTFERQYNWEIEHISWAKQADICVVAPATANFIGKYANGIADDILTTTILACQCPILIASAMNVAMYTNSIVQSNIEELKNQNIHL
jgi:phosphopantothenoylcysteine decarboxylase/phosphopantothenate--cysteine ligase